MPKTTHPTQTTKEKTSMTLSPEALRLLAELATRLGISKSAVIETLIREKAKTEQIK